MARRERPVPKDIEKKFALVAAKFAVKTGASPADVNDFMDAIFQILGEYMIRMKEKVH